jgi:DNA-binding SARP family transcriptional activator/tetratricopeptide (TPR) repeat protein
MIRHGDVPIKLPTRKAVTLLFYLAAEPVAHSRGHLADLFWPDLPPDRGRAALRNCLSYLRAAIDDAPGRSDHASHLVVDGDRISLERAANLDFDLRTVEVTVTALLTATDRTADQIDSLLHVAADAYRGPFLDGLSFDDTPELQQWLDLQRQRWHQQQSQILDRLSAAQLESGALIDARTLARRWVAHAPLDELAYRRLMEVCAATGDRTGALQAFATCCQILRDQLDAQPGAATRALAARIRGSIDLASDREPRALAQPTGSRALPDRREAPFVGRSEQLAILIEAYEEAARGQTTIALIVGEAGIGKTRLAREFLQWCVVKGADVLAGRALEAGGRVPFQPFADMLGQRLERENAPDDLLSNVWLAELSRLLPDLRDRYPDLPLPTSDEGAARIRLFEAVARLSQALARRAPVVLFVDDVQWADRASLDLLHYLARQWGERGVAVLLLLTSRSESLTEESDVASLIADVRRDARLHQIGLGRLTPGEVARLIESVGVSDADGAFARWVDEEAQGQPFFILETISALVDRGDLVPIDLTVGGRRLVPKSGRFDPSLLRDLLRATVGGIIRSRLRHLPASAQLVLAGAAVLAQESTFDEIAAVIGLAETEALAGLEELLKRQLVRETPRGPALVSAGYSFTHDRIRDVVYGELSDARRRLLHRRALDVRERAGAPAAELAHHALAGGAAEHTFRLSVRAGDEALRLSAARDAVSHYERALDLLATEAVVGVIVAPSQLGATYLQLGRALELIGDRSRSRETYESLRQLARDAKLPDLECAALNRLATLSAQEGSKQDLAVELLGQALAIAKAAGDHERLAETEWNLAQLAVYRPDPTATFVHGERALALARALGATELVGRSLNALAYAANYVGRFDDAVRFATEAGSIYQQLGERAMQADCLGLVARANVRRGRPASGIAAGRQALAISQEIDNPWGQVSSAYHLAPGLVDSGAYEEALQVTRRGTALARDLAALPLLIYSLNQLGSVCRALSRLDEATAAHEEASALSANLSSLFREQCAAELCADYALSGDWTRAGSCARLALAHRSSMLLNSGLTRWLEIEALARNGDRSDAESDLRQFAEQVGDNPRYRIPVFRSLAVLARTDGHDNQEVDYLEQAAALARQIGLPGELASIATALARRL